MSDRLRDAAGFEARPTSTMVMPPGRRARAIKIIGRSDFFCGGPLFPLPLGRCR